MSNKKANRYFLPRRLKGFTLVELLVVMAVSSVVVAGAWYAIRAFGQFNKKREHQSSVSRQMIQSRDRIAKDVFWSDSVIVEDEHVFLIQQDEVWLEYDITDSTLLRNGQNIDTLIISKCVALHLLGQDQ